MMTPSIFGGNLFDDFFDGFFDFPAFNQTAMQKAQKQLYGHHAANMMKTDVQERNGCYEVDIDIPGFKKEDLSLELKNGYLVISAAKSIDKEESEGERSFYIGDEIKQEDIRAKYESGVLRLRIPKMEEKRPEVEERKYIAIEG